MLRSERHQSLTIHTIQDCVSSMFACNVGMGISSSIPIDACGADLFRRWGEMLSSRLCIIRCKGFQFLATVAGTVILTCLVSVILANRCSASEPESEVYKLAPEDIVSVVVSRHPEFSGEYLIPPDAVINLPGIGEVKAAGKTLSELADHVKQQLSDRLQEPEVTVTLITARMQRAYVLGAVEKPGQYDVKPGWRITEAIAAAGGLAKGVESADCLAIVMRSDGRPRQTVKLTDVLRGPEEANFGIGSGDVLTVEQTETLPIYVTGRVKNPGIYRMRKDSARVVQALASAGGALEDAALTRVTVTHADGRVETVNASTILDGKPGTVIVLQPGDLVTVPEETSRIAVLGYVNEAGFYPVRGDREVSLSDALAMAKGADARLANLSKIIVVRTRGPEQERLTYDLNAFLRSGDRKHNPVLEPGDVVFIPRTGKLDWDTITRTIASVGVALSPLGR